MIVTHVANQSANIMIECHLIRSNPVVDIVLLCYFNILRCRRTKQLNKNDEVKNVFVEKTRAVTREKTDEGNAYYCRRRHSLVTKWLVIIFVAFRLRNQRLRHTFEVSLCVRVHFFLYQEKKQLRSREPSSAKDRVCIYFILFSVSIKTKWKRFGLNNILIVHYNEVEGGGGSATDKTFRKLEKK